jgi:hypothetical protein
MGAKVFNHLPTKIKSMPNDLKNFKSSISELYLLVGAAVT